MAGWNTTTHCLTYPFTKIAKNGQGDFQRALHTSKMKQSEQFAEGYINKMAKYKGQIISNNPAKGANPDGTFTDAQRLYTLYGLSVVKCGIVDYKTRYGEKWAYTRPTMGTHRCRCFDFIKTKAEQNVGYQDMTPWNEGVASSAMLWTIFGGIMGLVNEQCAPGDRVYFNMQCKENDEIDPYLGLLYPADFAGATNGYDLSQYYVGIAIIDSSNNVWVYSDPHISDYLSGINVYCGLDINLPTSQSLAYGDAIIAPVLTSTRQDSWTTNYQGNIINLDGAYIPIKIVQPGYHLKYQVSINVGSSKTTATITVTNETGSPVTISPMVGYLLSDYAEMNEYEVTGTGPDYQGEGANGYISRRWNLRPPEYKQGDIYSHDWDGGYYQPVDALAARFINLYSAFVAANGGSNVLTPSWPGSPHSVTFQVEVNATGDTFGSYRTAAPWLYILSVEGSAIMLRQFQ